MRFIRYSDPADHTLNHPYCAMNKRNPTNNPYDEYASRLSKIRAEDLGVEHYEGSAFDEQVPNQPKKDDRT